jgi:hypothetical protein
MEKIEYRYRFWYRYRPKFMVSVSVSVSTKKASIAHHYPKLSAGGVICMRETQSTDAIAIPPRKILKI